MNKLVLAAANVHICGYRADLGWGGKMPRPERPVDPGKGPAERFAVALRELRQSAGNPPYRVLAKRAHYSATTLAQAAAGERLPTLAVALAYARACNGDGA